MCGGNRDSGRPHVDGRGQCGRGHHKGASGSGGFGYDPVFLVPELGLTFAQIDTKTKNNMSHRARALARSLPMVEEALGI